MWLSNSSEMNIQIVQDWTETHNQISVNDYCLLELFVSQMNTCENPKIIQSGNANMRTVYVYVCAIILAYFVSSSSLYERTKHEEEEEERKRRKKNRHRRTQSDAASSKRI